MPKWRSLAPLHRALLVTGGTVTELLEALFMEPMTIAVIAQQELRPAANDHVRPECAASDRILDRRIDAWGGRAYVRATSHIRVDRLPGMLDDLSAARPLGKLMQAARLETFRQPVDVRAASGTPASGDGFEPALMRSYVVTNGGRSLPWTLRLPHA